MNLRLRHFLPANLVCALLIPLLSATASAEETKKADSPAAQEENQPAKETALEKALKNLKLPGVKINIEDRCVDVDAVICLDGGALELIACTKDTKEHESVVMIEAVPKHVHTALLLIGAVPGNPAMFKQVGEEGNQRWVEFPPRGNPVDVYLVSPDKDGKPTERPINDFITKLDDDYYDGGQEKKDTTKERFPTHTFLFAGSLLDGDGNGPRKYLSDISGNVISIATFGDEVLCLPDIHAHENGQLMWQIDSDNVPAVGTKVTLRLRPQFAKEAAKPEKD